MQVTTLGLVYPSLLLIYFGEAAYLGTFPSDFARSYFAAIPQALFWPMFVIATVSALVGSQSLITSAFSVARQSAVMSCFPPVRVSGLPLLQVSSWRSQIYLGILSSCTLQTHMSHETS